MTKYLDDEALPEGFDISSRLMAAYMIDGGSTLHLHAMGVGPEDRWHYSWVITDERGDLVGAWDEAFHDPLKSASHAEVNYAEMTGSLVSFLLACVEAKDESEGAGLFRPPVRTWARRNSTELVVAAIELDELRQR